MLKAIEGIYRNGTIQLAEMPQGVSESRVLAEGSGHITTTSIRPSSN